MKRTWRHPIRGDHLYVRPPRRVRNPNRTAKVRQPRIRPRRSVNVAALVASPEEVESNPSVRLRVVGIVVLLLFGVMILRLWGLQVVYQKNYAAAVNANQIRTVPVPAPRGEIVDRSGHVLVTNVTSMQIVLSRVEASQHPEVIGQVAALVGATPAQIQADLNNVRYSPYQPVPVLTNAPTATIQYLQEHQSAYPGVSVQSTTQRSYPQGGTTATHVLGYVGDISAQQLNALKSEGYTAGSQIGQSGIESQYEQYLRGKDGTQELEVDAQGNVVGTLNQTNPGPGDTVVLNMDLGLQQTLQNALAAQIQTDRHTADATTHRLPAAIDGAAVAIDPNNGAVLAMASWPTYDLNQWVGGISQADYAAITAPCQSIQNGCPTDNYAIQGLYTPGSTFKLVTATAALQDGLLSPGTEVDDTGTFTVPGCTGAQAGCSFHDDEAGDAGYANLQRALTISDDYYFYNLGYLFAVQQSKFGAQPIQDVAAQYGLGESTGIDLPNESVGRVDSAAERQKLHAEAPNVFSDTWYTGDNIEMAFGQGATVISPIEQAVAYATFANQGTRYAPQVANAIIDPTTGKVVTQITPKVTGHVSLPDSIYQPILAGLQGVISNPSGTAYGDFIGFPTSYGLAGKTGTADTTTGATEPDSWFVAFGPNPNPQVVIAVVIDQGGYGATAAAPVVRAGFNYLLTNPVSPVTLPTPANPATTAPPVTQPPFGTPAPTTTTTAPAG